MELNSATVSSFQVGKIFHNLGVNSIDFDSAGDLLACSTKTGHIRLYNVDSGDCRKKVQCKNHGTSIVRFTHHSNAVLVGSQNNWDESIHYLSLHDMRYLRHFKGHKNIVNTIAMSPATDCFIAGSIDGDVRLWDVRTSFCQGQMQVAGKPCVAYDPQGLVFAVADEVAGVRLYDARMYEQGPFDQFETVLKESGTDEKSTLTNLKFAPNGAHILLSTTDKILLIDAYEGDVVQKYTSHLKEDTSHSELEASFSPDGQYVLSGSEDGQVYVWETMTGKEHILHGNPRGFPVPCVQWNPKKMMIATAGSQLAMWQPKPKENTTKSSNPFRSAGHRVTLDRKSTKNPAESDGSTLSKKQKV